LNIYADSSFLVSLFIPDAHSVAALRTMESSDGIVFVTSFGEMETVNAFGLRVFRREASLADTAAARNHFESDLRDGIFQFRGLPELVFERARQLSLQTTAKLGTRAADLLHVATALELGSNYFYSFDRKQRNLAQAVGLKLN
jgi:predicted nucleic acid-binding protein